MSEQNRVILEADYTFSLFLMIKLGLISGLVLTIITLILVGLTRVATHYKRKEVAQRIQRDNRNFPILAFFHP